MRTKIKMKSCLLMILLSFILVGIGSTSVYAGEKQMQVVLDKDYEACTFNLTFEEPGDYTAVLTNEKGDSYEYAAIDDTTMSCMVTKAKSGTWTTDITGTQDDIGKVTLKVVTAATNDTNIVDNNISVGKDINGLEMYFKDDSFVVEWTDENCGPVNIKIVNLDTAETICNEKVSDKRYECPIPEGTSNISVSVVPSTSANIEGAALTYTYEVNNHPDATVTYPEQEITNKDKVNAEVTISQPYKVYVEVNGENAGINKNFDQAGTYEVSIPIKQDGNNEIKLYIVDNDGNMRSYPYTVIKDTVPPTLELSEAYDGMETDQEVFTISGYVTNYDTFYINEKQIKTATDGFFSYDCDLHEGMNSINVSAFDTAGNEVFYDITVTYTPKNFNFSIGDIAAVVAAILCILYVIWKRNKKRKNNTPDLKSKNIDDTEQEKINHTSIEGQEWNSEEIVQEKNTEPDEEKETTDKKKEKKVGKWVKIAVVTVIAMFILMTVVLQVGFVNSDSMNPAIKSNSLTIGCRLTYMVSGPQRGDIISFKHDGQIYGKRVIGIPGDSIEFHDGYVYLNGEKLEEDYLDPDIETNSMKKYVVPDKTVFVLGDNRVKSYDSRYWDDPYVKVKDIQSKILLSIHL